MLSAAWLFFSFVACAMRFARVLWHVGLSHSCLGSILSSSSLEVCNDDGEKLACVEKLVLWVTVEHGVGGTEVLSFDFDTLTEPDGKERLLAHPWKVSLSKSPASFDYELSHLGDVNYAAQETFRAWPDSSDNCRNRDWDADVSCPMGKRYDSDGQYIEYSPGFCCHCDDDADDMLNCRRIAWSNDFHRENTRAIFCLTWDEKWYSVYNVGPARMYYNVLIKIVKPVGADVHTSAEPELRESLLTIDANQPLVYAEDHQFLAEIVGDFAWTTQPQNFGGKHLVSESGSVIDPQESLLLDKSHFDLSGRTCNKVGVSYSAFYNQTDRCGNFNGTCLKNQLNYWIPLEDSRRESGSSPQHRVTAFCDDSSMRTDTFLSCSMSQRQTTMLRIEVPVEPFQFNANGEILHVIAEEYHSLNGAQDVKIVVKNTGRIPANFACLGNCSFGVALEASDWIIVEPKEENLCPMSVWTTMDFGPNSIVASCSAKLWDAVGRLQDEYTFDIVVHPKLLNHIAGTEEFVLEDNQTTSCEVVCPGMIEVFCFLYHGCMDRLFYVLVFVIGMFASCGVLLRLLVGSLWNYTRPRPELIPALPAQGKHIKSTSGGMHSMARTSAGMQSMHSMGIMRRMESMQSMQSIQSMQSMRSAPCMKGASMQHIKGVQSMKGGKGLLQGMPGDSVKTKPAVSVPHMPGDGVKTKPAVSVPHMPGDGAKTKPAVSVPYMPGDSAKTMPTMSVPYSSG